MVDHLERADELRKRAAQFRLTADEIKSTKFGECYGKLADNYLALAELEEGFARRRAVMRRTASEGLLPAVR
jgi:hypothetical protein